MPLKRNRFPEYRNLQMENDMKKMKDWLFLGLCVAMILLSVWGGVHYGKAYVAARQSYFRAEAYTKKASPTKAPETQRTQKKNQVKKPSKRLKAPISVDFQNLFKVNPDVVAWIYVESVEISYPILKGPDNDYYLHRTWERKDNFAGSIFMDYRNGEDFSDYHTVLYGHNMKDGTMFHKTQYVMTEKYYEKSPYIWILTPEGDYRYRIFSSYDTRYDSDTYSFFWHPGKELEEYIKACEAQSLWKKETELSGSERILTLSTCNGLTDIRRVVQAARTEEVNHGE